MSSARVYSGFTITNSFNQTFPYLAQFGITYGTLTRNSRVRLSTAVVVLGTNSATLPIIVSQQFNAQGLLTINGMELDYFQPLDFLLEQHGLPGFGFTANVTIPDQKSSAAPAIAGGVAPLTYNATAYYDNGAISARLSYVFNDKSYASQSNTPEPLLSEHLVPTGLPGRRISIPPGLWSDGLLSSLRLSSCSARCPPIPR